MAFMTNDAYPGGAKAVDDHIGDRISDLSRAVSDGFGRIEWDNQRIEQRFDKMVTQSEFNATVQRLDGQDKTIEEKVDKGLDELRNEMSSGLTRVSGEVKAGFKATADADKARTTKTRWLIGAGVAGLGVVNAVIFNIIGLFLRP